MRTNKYTQRRLVKILIFLSTCIEHRYDDNEPSIVAILLMVFYSFRSPSSLHLLDILLIKTPDIIISYIILYTMLMDQWKFRNDLVRTYITWVTSIFIFREIRELCLLKSFHGTNYLRYSDNSKIEVQDYL